MPSTHHDLPLTNYVLLGIFAVAYEALGLRAAITMVATLAVGWVLLAILLTLARHWGKRRRENVAPLNEWGQKVRQPILHRGRR